MTTDDTRPLDDCSEAIAIAHQMGYADGAAAERARHAALVAAAREYSDRSMPIHDRRCAAQDDDQPCFCGSSAVYAALLTALASEEAGT